MTDLNALTLSDLYTELARQGFVRRLLELARDEDLGPPAPGCAPWQGDVTSTAGLASGADGTATLAARQGGVIAGLATIPELLEVFGVQARWIPAAADGQRVEGGATLGRLCGPLGQVLAVERTLLNLVSRLSGVATRTASFVQAVAGIDVQLLDTRKTTPGLRVLEKYAVRCGGGFCHRIGLHDALLIKDNHLAGISPDRLASFVRAAVERARAAAAQSATALRFAEVEVDSLDQLRALLDAGGAGADIILLDNMSAAMLREAVHMRDGSKCRVLLEASGGVRLDTVRNLAETGIDRISVGGLTHQAVSIDTGLDVISAGCPES
ncbi:MAG: carboxylating nicotinate-nucleotide diphosphorylase [Phycisphaeraceae bacterium]|nr:carboxylating nicotinate-nucleotide diphosphorylase [Phycisphaeraceae bacterium]